MIINCKQRGCKLEIAGDVTPNLCPICKNPLIGYSNEQHVTFDTPTAKFLSENFNLATSSPKTS